MRLNRCGIYNEMWTQTAFLNFLLVPGIVSETWLQVSSVPFPLQVP